MGSSPYTNLPPKAFWKTGVCQADPYSLQDIYSLKFAITPETKIALAGSCFAQHLGRSLITYGYNVLDLEPPPPGLLQEFQHKYGYSIYSARYGNIYTVRHLLQLAQEATGERVAHNHIWIKNGRFFDALRPVVEPNGLDSAEEVILHRNYHLSKIRELLLSLDLFVFTLGLTEMWMHKASGTVFPTAPGTIVGHYDPSDYAFINSEFNDVMADFQEFLFVLERIRSGRPFNVLLTVSPVPLTATASGDHVLVSTIYSKSILRAVAGQLSQQHPNIDYFPAYEIVTNPRLCSSSFSENLRSVTEKAVENVMQHFHAVYGQTTSRLRDTVSESMADSSNLDLQCEEALIEAFLG